MNECINVAHYHVNECINVAHYHVNECINVAHYHVNECINVAYDLRLHCNIIFVLSSRTDRLVGPTAKNKYGVTK